MGKMAVSGCESAAMVYDNQLSITVLPAHKRYRAAGSRDNRVTPGSFDVLTGMKFVGAPAKRIAAATKAKRAKKKSAES